MADGANPTIEEAVRLLKICDEQRRRQTYRGLGEFGASTAEIDFRRGLDGMISDFLAAYASQKEKTKRDAF